MEKQRKKSSKKENKIKIGQIRVRDAADTPHSSHKKTQHAMPGWAGLVRLSVVACWLILESYSFLAHPVKLGLRHAVHHDLRPKNVIGCKRGYGVAGGMLSMTGKEESKGFGE